jgi:GNAT superfamily N-acetyltransferase
MSNFVIRRAQVLDWEAFQSFLKHDRPIDSLKAAFVRYQAKIGSDLHGVFVAELEGRVVGIAMAHVWDEFIMSGRKQIRFSSLFVHPDYQCLGIGKALFETTRDWAKA